ncbi:acyl-homoserine-lactone synthase [Paraburkholderia graminis]|uniref:acyl-homoserine-lactone synthase n=1 Tax=Paraburkholderia graminis TaxID=60548 RepID=UPI0038B899D5
MSHIIAGRLDELPSDIRRQLGSFRHKVFIQRLHWEIPGVPHDATSEWDQFDAQATVHLVALSADGQVCGCARLMPTTGPCLLRDVFPQLVSPGALPSSPSIWELSRFAASGLPDHRTVSTSGMSFFPYAMALALSFGATRVVGVLSHSVARLYRRFGLDLRDIGVGAAPGRASVVACSIDLGLASFHRLGCDPVTLLNAITLVGEHLPPEPSMPACFHPTRANPPASGGRGDGPLPVCDNSTAQTRAIV